MLEKDIRSSLTSTLDVHKYIVDIYIHILICINIHVNQYNRISISKTYSWYEAWFKSMPNISVNIVLLQTPHNSICIFFKGTHEIP